MVNVIYGYEFAWGDNRSKGHILKEWLEVREDIKAVLREISGTELNES
jgi:hypothetical protein